ncbi:MAG: PilC/PilY family type IV pilus protein [Pseudomonadota bacterium]|nr:PilC/PilY family type IV pilus protein [Pseudomonadota bacterium]
MITLPIRCCIALLATAITVLGLLGPTRALAAGCSADVVFLMDNTGSMQPQIDATRSNADEILNKISGGDDRFEGIDVQYAVATYWGDPLEHVGAGSPSMFHCPSGSLDVTPAPENFSGRSGSFEALETEEYYVDLIDAYGDGWTGNQLTLKKVSSHPLTTTTFGSTFFTGSYKSGGKVTLTADATYEWSIDPYGGTYYGCTSWEGFPYSSACLSYGWTEGGSPYWGSDILWRICPVSSSPPPVTTGYPDIARKAFKVNQAMTDSTSEIETGMAEWAACSAPGGCGGDWPEAGYFALHQLGTEGDFTDGKCEPGFTGSCTDLGFKTNDAIGWREGAGKVIVLFGDAPSHCSTVSLNEAFKALKSKNIVVAAINTYDVNQGIDTKSACDGTSPTAGQATNFVEATKGTLTNNVTGSTNTVDAILDAVSQGVAQTGSAAAVSFSSSKLETTTYLYQSYFDANKWSGDLKAFQLNATTGRLLSAEPVWSAAEKLDAKTPDSRVILTMGKEGDTAASADVPVPFRWDSLSATQQRDLRTQHGETKEESEERGQARLAYLRGDRSNEGMTGHKFRLRDSRLGDIWHSSPIYYANPSLDWPDSAKFGKGDLYSDFKKDNADRDGVVYVGGNDGMLHAFDADSGEEIMAYVPGNLYSSTIYGGYHQLTDPNFEHTSIYVDGTPYVSDAYIRTRSITSESWRTVLIGTEADGGRGLFALDVTNPSGFSESTPKNVVLWEFSNADDDHLGKTFSRPTVALLNNGRWAVITGNGPEDTAVDGTAGDAQLFIIYFDGGLDGSWTKNEDYLRITTTVGKQTDRNGLFTPALIDLDGNGTMDRAYAGDLKGRMWAFDLSSSDQTQWAVAHRNKKPLFKGKKNQPITTQPEVIRHPTIKGEGVSAPNLMVLFGTGQFLRTADNTLQHKQSYYGVWDRGFEEGNLRRGDLMKQKFLVNDVSTRKRVLDPLREPNYEASEGGARQYGWYIDLPSTGERVNALPLVRGNEIHFNTIIPEASICATGGGTGWEMAIDTNNGGSPTKAIFDFNEDGVILALDDTYTVTTGSDVTVVGYAGRKVAADKGMPSGPSIIGDMKYTPAMAAEGGGEIVTTQLDEESEYFQQFKEGGRYSWQRLPPPRPTPPAGPA